MLLTVPSEIPSTSPEAKYPVDPRYALSQLLSAFAVQEAIVVAPRSITRNSYGGPTEQPLRAGSGFDEVDGVVSAAL